MSVCALVGGQFGSEGKGLIVGHIAKHYTAHVRVGAANAGHTLYTWNGDYRVEDPDPVGTYEKHVMQQVPCAAYANPHARLYIGPGALISPDILGREIGLLWRWRLRRNLSMPPLLIDSRAHVIQEEHIEREQESTLAERIGSTSTIAREGIGAAQAARAMRDESCVQAWEALTGHDFIQVMPLARKLQWEQRILLEGTQGYGLSNTTGDFPYVTSRNTTAAGLCADAGIAPNRLNRVILVCRSYPIRVAGNSGPFGPGSEEITWDDIGVNREKERTTVTKKIRRVATFSIEQVKEAAVVNGATEIALTFADYLDPKIEGKTEWGSHGKSAYPKVRDRIDWIEGATGLRVTMVGTGPHTVIDRT